MIKELFLIAVICYGCISESNRFAISSTQPEIDVINCALPELIPEIYPCGIPPKIGEENSDYDKRLQAYHEKLDSIGKKFENVSTLKKLDSTYIEAYKTWQLFETFPYLINSPNEDRAIDPSQIKGVKDVQFLFIDSTQSAKTDPNDCSILGRITFTRVGFNIDSTKAAFRYYVANNRAAAFESKSTGILVVERIDDTWEIINK